MCYAFRKQGVEVKLYMEGDEQFKENLDSFVKSAFNVPLSFNVDYWKPFCNNRLINRFLIRKRIERILVAENPDIVFTREPALLSTITKKGFKVIFESHNAKLHNRFSFVHNYLKKSVVRTAKREEMICLFSISKALSSYWASQGVEKAKLFSWHDGFEETLFNIEQKKEEARKRTNLPREKIIITYTGGLYPDREIENIILLAKHNPSLLFVIIGGPEKNKILFNRLAEQQDINNIQFLGFVEHNQIPDYLFSSDVLLALWSSKVPTINYCSPLKLFEYMASGRAILAHGFPTIQEVLTDGKNAIICAPDNFEALNAKLKLAVKESEKSDMGYKARKLAFEKYSWDSRVENLLLFLKQST
jgi:glycosyltransferase involved in cell wall biosynthesis